MDNRVALALMVLTLPIAAQPTTAPQFEVSTVKPISQTMSAGALRGCSSLFRISGNRVDVTCASVLQLVAYAFETSPDQVTGPDWLANPGAAQFDIAATIPAGAKASLVPSMLRSLLEERFKIATHRGTAERPVYALIVARSGLNIKEAVADAVATNSADQNATSTLIGDVLVRTVSIDGVSTIITESEKMGIIRETPGPNRARHWEATAATMEGLADLLDQATPLTPPVVDMTDLKGRYHFTLEVPQGDVMERVRQAVVNGGPGAFQNAQTEMEEGFFDTYNVGLRKLGLQLDRRKGMVQTIVVDRAEKMPNEN